MDILPAAFVFAGGLLLGAAIGIKIGTTPSQIKIKPHRLVKKRSHIDRY